MSNGSERTFKLLIYESEYRQIQTWTNKHQDVETGGDLFGLWLDERTAVIQLVVGPGKQCRRTSTSFYQDIDYLKRMGDALTLEEGLCHIGEWHSHHRLNIPRPSRGDESTVWSNMDRYGLSRFCLLIANISTTWKWFQLSSVPVDITVNGFLFEVGRRNQRCLPILQAEFTFLHEESPFRSKYLPAIWEGAESLNSAEDQLQVVVKKCQLLEMGQEKILQEKQEVEASLATERHTRQEAEKELRNVRQQAFSDAQIRVTEEAEKTVNCLLQQLQSYEQKSRDLETSLNAEREARNSMEAALDEEQKAHKHTMKKLWNTEQRSQELERNLAAERQAREKTKGDLMRSSKLGENSASTVQQNVVGHNTSSRDATCVWSLSYSEVAMSNSVIREGQWGHVVEGRLHGFKVAVKVVHPNIVPLLDQSVLQRKMGTALDCYHPCLVQVIGLSYSQRPLFVTELLETNLRAVLLERALEHSEITTIALDVAEGLNYLHCKCPAAPIVHQEISSTNVFLWKEGEHWRAKVSDCISDKILQQSMAISPFDLRYAAPETRIPLLLKIDIFSFGVLLCEMNLRDLPADVLQIKNQVNSLSYCNPYKWLMIYCLRESPSLRPSMEEIIEKMKRL